MKWKKGLPTEPGHYWWCVYADSGEEFKDLPPGILEVLSCGHVAAVGEEGCMSLQIFEGWWYGPLVPPEKPT